MADYILKPYITLMTYFHKLADTRWNRVGRIGICILSLSVIKILLLSKAHDTID